MALPKPYRIKKERKNEKGEDEEEEEGKRNNTKRVLSFTQMDFVRDSLESESKRDMEKKKEAERQGTIERERRKRELSEQEREAREEMNCKSSSSVGRKESQESRWQQEIHTRLRAKREEDEKRRES